MDIRIMLLVGSNGRAAACIEGDMGWGDLADNIMDYDPVARKSSDPDESKRYVITTSVPLPAIDVQVVEAEAQPS